MSLLLRVQLRPYQVTRPFVFKGMSFEPGSVFDPVKAGCDLPKLDRLVSNRYLDATIIPDAKSVREAKQAIKAPEVSPVVEAPVETESQTISEPEQEPEQIVEQEPEETSYEEPVVTTTTTRRRRTY